MKCTLWTAVTIALLAVCGITSAQAQEDRPWRQPGTQVGQEIIGPDGGLMVWVPAGEFPMGSTFEQVAAAMDQWPQALRDQAQAAIDAETPQRQVAVEGFWISKHPVTYAQYRAFCEATGRPFPSQTFTSFPPETFDGEDHPVAWVSWDDAVAYCEHYGLTLPTEAQWEYAARGPEGRIYPWGDEWNPEALYWAGSLGPGDTASPVGSFPDGASWCGALDMAGNVYEWCADWFDPNHYSEAATTDPEGPDEPVSYMVATPSRLYHYPAARVMRGGSALNLIPADFRTAHRSGAVPQHRSNLIGFRPVSWRTPPLEHQPLAWTEQHTYRVGDPITVEFRGLPGNDQDWINVVRLDEPDDTWGDWTYTRGRTEGVEEFRHRRDPGEYEVRVYFDWPRGQYEVQSRHRFTVEP